MERINDRAPEGPVPHPHKACWRCDHHGVLPTLPNPAALVCRAEPVRLLLAIVPTPQGPRPISHQEWPVVHRDEFCGRFTPDTRPAQGDPARPGNPAEAQGNPSHTTQESK